MPADLESDITADFDGELRLRMIRELERFLSGTLSKLDGPRRVIPMLFGSSKWSATRSAPPGLPWYDKVSRCGETGPC
jgi:hypothetical protein